MEGGANVILIFGCSPHKTVGAVSSIATGLIEKLRQIRQANGSILFPTLDFLKWRPNNEGEMVIVYDRQVLLRPTNQVDASLKAETVVAAEEAKAETVVTAEES